MKKRKEIRVICAQCGKEFNKPESEVKRTIQRNSKHLCSRTCVGKSNTINLPKEYNNKNLNAGNRKDEYTGFRDYLRRAKRRDIECNLTLEYLKQIWKIQNNRCVYTGIIIQHPCYRRENNPIYTASLDRIDSNKGYIKGNVQFVSTSINYMKGSMSHEETLKMINIIKISN